MENSSSSNSTVPNENKSNYVTLKMKRPKVWAIVIGIIVVVIILVLIFGRGLFLAASVNGVSISRSALNKELQKQGGKQVLEGMINKKLIETELNKQKVTVTKEEVDAEIKKIEEKIAAQGGTLSEMLKEQGLTEADLRTQITTQKKLEKVLADKVTVTDAEIDAYIKDSKAVIPKDMKPEDFRKSISDQIKGQKFSQEAQKWVADLTAKAKIKYYVNF
ncbi:MAG: SurA N-terminal domain-containing protein [Patescibacteria group bacterium]